MTSTQFIYSPYLLLVAIPLIGLSLIPYFKVGKKYRRTRNRILSLVLHCVTIALVTLALSGIQFVHDVSNTANELILVVDMSDTQEESADNRDGFINDVLKESVYQNFSVGVVTFGLDQVYAVPLTSDAGSVYAKYKRAEKRPDTSATDIEAALEYATTLFTHPESGKIVLITDGKETDGNVVSSYAVSTMMARGIKFDTVYIPSDYDGNEFQILSVKTPDFQVKAGMECSIEVTVFSRDDGYARLNMYDNGKPVKIGKGEEATTEYSHNLSRGTQVISIPHVFDDEGLHEIKVELIPVNGGAQDWNEKNNVYFTYANLNVFKKVLIIENYTDESVKLKDVLKDTEALGEGEEYEVSIYNLTTDILTSYEGEEPEVGESPKSVDDLRKYDQIILNNVSNEDLTSKVVPLDTLLNSYVYEYGGGMLTVGGSDPNTVTANNPYGDSHAYNRADMYGSNYQKMLPVEAVNYTPPVGVFIIIDVSGSMTQDNRVIDGKFPLEWAKDGAMALLSEGTLSERDKVGIMTLGSDYANILPLTPRTDKQKILDAIKKIEGADSGTDFLPSLTSAVDQLKTAQMEKNHIIFISDGEVKEDDMKACMKDAAGYYADEKLNLTISMVCIGGIADPLTKDLVAATRSEDWFNDHAAGEPGSGYYDLDSSNVDSISTMIMEDVKAPLISSINYGNFNPVVYNRLSQVVQGVELNGNTVNATLGGYYGVKKKNQESVDLILAGNYQVPIYARWKFGKGSVGSFMCDLKGGEWSGDFMDSVNGKKLIYNIIDDLMPTTTIRPQEILTNLSSKNYGNHLTCPSTLEEGQSIRGAIYTPNGERISLNEVGEGEGWSVSRALSEANKYSVCEFTIREGGVYTIVLEKIDANEKVLSSVTLYKEFSYSKEYDAEFEMSDAEIRDLLKGLATRGNGSAYEAGAEVDVDVADIFREFETVLRKVFDPRLIFIIVAALLLLLDVAVRKFKFKWIHEIIREKKEKKQGGTIRKEDRYEEDN